MSNVTVYVGAAETISDFRIRRVTVAVPNGANCTALNRVLRAVAQERGGDLWDRTFTAPQKGFGGKRVNHLHFPADAKLPDVGDALRRAGFEVRALEAGK